MGWRNIPDQLGRVNSWASLSDLSGGCAFPGFTRAEAIMLVILSCAIDTARNRTSRLAPGQ